MSDRGTIMASGSTARVRMPASAQAQQGACLTSPCGDAAGAHNEWQRDHHGFWQHSQGQNACTGASAAGGRSHKFAQPQSNNTP